MRSAARFGAASLHLRHIRWHPSLLSSRDYILSCAGFVIDGVKPSTERPEKHHYQRRQTWSELAFSCTLLSQFLLFCWDGGCGEGMK
jgi:hypothetical protein